MAEGAIVIGCFVIVFACMWAATRYQNAKIRAMDDGRHAAWKAALNACSGGGDLTSAIGNVASDSGSGAIPDVGQANDLVPGGVLSQGSFTNDSGYVTVTKTRVAQFPFIIGGAVFPMQGRYYVRCNEPKKDDTGDKWFGIIFAGGAIIAVILALT
jgi:hypothetical protein